MYSKILAGLGIGSLLLASAPLAMAHEREDGDDIGSNVSTQVRVEHGDNEHNNGLQVGSTIGNHEGWSKHDDDTNDDDRDDAHGTIGTTTGTTTMVINPDPAVVRAQVLTELRSHVASGIVGTVGSSTFTVGSNTVLTNSNTTYVANGAATTSGAVTAGSNVLVIGDATTTPTNGQVLMASFVAILGAGWDKLTSFLHF